MKPRQHQGTIWLASFYSYSASNDVYVVCHILFLLRPENDTQTTHGIRNKRDLLLAFSHMNRIHACTHVCALFVHFCCGSPFFHQLFADTSVHGCLCAYKVPMIAVPFTQPITFGVAYEKNKNQG